MDRSYQEKNPGQYKSATKAEEDGRLFTGHELIDRVMSPAVEALLNTLNGDMKELFEEWIPILEFFPIPKSKFTESPSKQDEVFTVDRTRAVAHNYICEHISKELLKPSICYESYSAYVEQAKELTYVGEVGGNEHWGHPFDILYKEEQIDVKTHIGKCVCVPREGILLLHVYPDRVEFKGKLLQMTYAMKLAMGIVLKAVNTLQSHCEDERFPYKIFNETVDKDKIKTWLDANLREHHMPSFEIHVRNARKMLQVSDNIRGRVEDALWDVVNDPSFTPDYKQLAVEESNKTTWKAFYDLLPKPKEDVHHVFGSSQCLLLGGPNIDLPASAFLLKNGIMTTEKSGIFTLIRKMKECPSEVGSKENWGIKLKQGKMTDEEILEMEMGGWHCGKGTHMREQNPGPRKRKIPGYCVKEAEIFEEMIEFMAENGPHANYMDELTELYDGLMKNIKPREDSVIDTAAVETLGFIKASMTSQAMRFAYLNSRISQIMNRIPKTSISNAYLYQLTNNAFLLFRGDMEKSFAYTVLEQVEKFPPLAWHEHLRLRCFVSEGKKFVQHNWRKKLPKEFEDSLMFTRGIGLYTTLIVESITPENLNLDFDKKELARCIILTSISNDESVRNLKATNSGLESGGNDYTDPGAMAEKMKDPVSFLENGVYHRYYKSMKEFTENVADKPPKPRLTKNETDIFGLPTISVPRTKYPAFFVRTVPGGKHPLEHLMMEAKIFIVASRFTLHPLEAQLKVLLDIASKAKDSQKMLHEEREFGLLYSETAPVYKMNEDQIVERIRFELERAYRSGRRNVSSSTWEMFLGSCIAYREDIEGRKEDLKKKIGEREKIDKSALHQLRSSSGYDPEEGQITHQGGLIMEELLDMGSDISFGQFLCKNIPKSKTYIDSMLVIKYGEAGKKVREFSVESIADYLFNHGCSLMSNAFRTNIITNRKDKKAQMQERWNEVKRKAKEYLNAKDYGATGLCMLQIVSDITGWSPNKQELENFFSQLPSWVYLTDLYPELTPLMHFAMGSSIIICRRKVSVQVDMPDGKLPHLSEKMQERHQIKMWKEALKSSPWGDEGRVETIWGGTMGKTHPWATTFQDFKERLILETILRKIGQPFLDTLNVMTSADDIEDDVVVTEDVDGALVANIAAKMRRAGKEENSRGKSTVSFGVRGTFLSVHSVGCNMSPEKVTDLFAFLSQGKFSPSFGTHMASIYGDLQDKIIKGVPFLTGYLVFMTALVPGALDLHHATPVRSHIVNGIEIKTKSMYDVLKSEYLPYAFSMVRGVTMEEFETGLTIPILDLHRALTNPNEILRQYIGALDPDFTFISEEIKGKTGSVTTLKHLSGLKIKDRSREANRPKKAKEAMREFHNVPGVALPGDEIGLEYTSSTYSLSFQKGINALIGKRKFFKRKDPVEAIGSYSRSRCGEIVKVGNKMETITKALEIYISRANEAAKTKKDELMERCKSILKALDPMYAFKTDVASERRYHHDLIWSPCILTYCQQPRSLFETPPKELAYAIKYGIEALSLIACVDIPTLRKDLKIVITVFGDIKHLDFETIASLLTPPRYPDVVFLPMDIALTIKSPMKAWREAQFANIVAGCSFAHVSKDFDDSKNVKMLRNFARDVMCVATAGSPSFREYRRRIRVARINGVPIMEKIFEANEWLTDDDMSRLFLEIAEDKFVSVEHVKWHTGTEYIAEVQDALERFHEETERILENKTREEAMEDDWRDKTRVRYREGSRIQYSRVDEVHGPGYRVTFHDEQPFIRVRSFHKKVKNQLMSLITFFLFNTRNDIYLAERFEWGWVPGKRVRLVIGDGIGNKYLGDEFAQKEILPCANVEEISQGQIRVSYQGVEGFIYFNGSVSIAGLSFDNTEIFGIDMNLLIEKEAFAEFGAFNLPLCPLPESHDLDLEQFLKFRTDGLSANDKKSIFIYWDTQLKEFPIQFFDSPSSYNVLKYMRDDRNYVRRFPFDSLLAFSGICRIKLASLAIRKKLKVSNLFQKKIYLKLFGRGLGFFRYWVEVVKEKSFKKNIVSTLLEDAYEMGQQALAFHEEVADLMDEWAQEQVAWMIENVSITEIGSLKAKINLAGTTLIKYNDTWSLGYGMGSYEPDAPEIWWSREVWQEKNEIDVAAGEWKAEHDDMFGTLFGAPDYEEEEDDFVDFGDVMSWGGKGGRYHDLEEEW